jgi:hypothetical protein
MLIMLSISNLDLKSIKSNYVKKNMTGWSRLWDRLALSAGNAHGNIFEFEVMIMNYCLCLWKTNHGIRFAPILIKPD